MDDGIKSLVKLSKFNCRPVAGLTVNDYFIEKIMFVLQYVSIEPSSVDWSAFDDETC